MARALSVSGQAQVSLTEGWCLALSPAGACATPGDAAALTDWIPAAVPGTTASALRTAGRFDVEVPTPLHDQDVWWRLDLSGTGPRILEFQGLATLCEVWLDDALILTSDSMFQAHSLPVTLTGQTVLWLCFRALTERLERKLPRARWRPRMIPRQGLRGIRTTLLGQMPGWTPAVEAVGPWRPILCITPGPLTVVEADLHATMDGETGQLSARLVVDGAMSEPVLSCAGQSVTLTRAADGAFTGLLDLPGVAPWWPHTHGEPALHAVSVRVGETVIDLGRTGFRHIARDDGPDGTGFGLKINGQSVFCRGAVWTTSDILGLAGTREAYAPWLHLAREAGMNMLRMSGTGAYESPAFFELCDELGILVWQDFMFANFDYPVADPAFAEQVAQEADEVLNRVQLSPSLVVLCGGSEVHQQATMMGLKPAQTASPLYDQILPAAVARRRPDAVYVQNSPCGGALPFSPGTGVAHYFGVGAYLRPLEDARRAGVKFASECLAFANVPGAATLNEGLPGLRPGDPRWKARTPRDLGADWDFEDVRDHYLALLHGVDPLALRDSDPALYLDLSRAVSGQVMEATYAEWRRAASPCQGALVWTFQDIVSGAGWGVIDSLGRPKPAFYALKRAFRPLHLGLTDEGGDGLAIHLVNETPEPLDLELELTCLREGTTPVVSARRPVSLPARSTQTLSAYEVIGAFFDITYAYRFGPLAHDTTVVRLRRPGEAAVLVEAVHFPSITASPEAATVTAALAAAQDGAWTLILTTDRVVRIAYLAVEGFTPDDDWLCLTPGPARTITLTPTHGAPPSPMGTILAPGGGVLATFG